MAIVSFVRHFVVWGAAPPAQHHLLELGVSVTVALEEHVYWKCKQSGRNKEEVSRASNSSPVTLGNCNQ